MSNYKANYITNSLQFVHKQLWFLIVFQETNIATAKQAHQDIYFDVLMCTCWPIQNTPQSHNPIFIVRYSNCLILNHYYHKSTENYHLNSIRYIKPFYLIFLKIKLCVSKINFCFQKMSFKLKISKFASIQNKAHLFKFFYFLFFMA